MDDAEGIYEAYADEVKRFLLCLTTNVDLAEELTQETFYQAVKSIKRYNGSCKMSVWLCQIAKHAFYDYLKKEKSSRHASLEELSESGDMNTLAAPDDTAAEAEAKSEAVALYRKIHTLPEPYREVFLLRASTELSFREIGEIFGNSENWARVTYYRAKTKLYERIDKDGD